MIVGERVRAAIAAGWHTACDGTAALQWFRVTPYAGRGDYRILKVRAGDREVEVAVSPTGRSVRVYVDNVEVPR